MKKWLCVLVTVLLLGASVLGGCGDKGKKVQVYAPDGAPAIGLAKLIDDGVRDTEFHVVTPSDIGGYVLNGSADIAIMPTNAAALLYSKGADVAMLGVTNFGSLYLVGTQDVQDLADLKGQVVYSIGKGNVPDLVFRYLLQQADIAYAFSDAAVADKVALAYVSEGTEFIAGLKANSMQYGVISEPAATQAGKAVSGAKKLLDIQAQYETATNTDHGFPQAALVVKKSFYEKNTAYVKNFVAAFKAGAKWAETSPADALTAIKNAGSTAVPALNEAIAKGCNLGFTAAADCKQQLLDFYAALNGVKETGETPVGATLPDDAFFLSDPTV